MSLHAFATRFALTNCYGFVRRRRAALRRRAGNLMYHRRERAAYGPPRHRFARRTRRIVSRFSRDDFQ
ncbi:hypothetical protein [Paraburkholderia jirisanensis]